MKLISAGDLTSASPVFAVRWCLDRSEVERLKELEAENIHVLFVIRYEGCFLEDRQLVPLDQMLAYLTFRRPGEHTVFAKVVWRNAGSKPEKALKQAVLSKFNSGHYLNKFLNYDRTGFSERLLSGNGVKTLRCTNKLTVTVPREHFPKEQPEWLKQAVNAWYEYPAVDPCQFRRRLPSLLPKAVAYGCWFFISMVTRACFAFLMLGIFGMRGVKFSTIFHPLRDGIGDVNAGVLWWNSWYTHTKEGNRRKWVDYLLPVISVVGFVFINCVVSFLEVQEKKRMQAYDNLHILLVCESSVSAGLASLPPQRQTVRLRYLDLKAKLCRPYAVG
ncbi:MAG: hypothetical protein ACYC8S_01320 [Minisyncoccota bacterium]